MHPMMINALANQLATERKREYEQAASRSLAYRRRPSRATNSRSAIARDGGLRRHRGLGGRVVATLIRRTGNWDLAEECAQQAFAEALPRWSGTAFPSVRVPG